MSSPHSVINKTTKVLKIALLGFVSGCPGEWQPGTDYGSLEASSLQHPACRTPRALYRTPDDGLSRMDRKVPGVQSCWPAGFHIKKGAGVSGISAEGFWMYISALVPQARPLDQARRDVERALSPGTRALGQGARD